MSSRAGSEAVSRRDAHGYWLREAAAGPTIPGPATPPLDRGLSADVVIVGGGYAGLWTAWAILEQAPDARVAVLDARTCGAGPSGRNAGFVNPFWHRLDALVALFGDRSALAICEKAGARSTRSETGRGATTSTSAFGREAT